MNKRYNTKAPKDGAKGAQISRGQKGTTKAGKSPAARPYTPSKRVAVEHDSSCEEQPSPKQRKLSKNAKSPAKTVHKTAQSSGRKAKEQSSDNNNATLIDQSSDDEVIVGSAKSLIKSIKAEHGKIKRSQNAKEGAPILAGPVGDISSGRSLIHPETTGGESVQTQNSEGTHDNDQHEYDGQGDIDDGVDVGVDSAQDTYHSDEYAHEGLNLDASESDAGNRSEEQRSEGSSVSSDQASCSSSRSSSSSGSDYNLIPQMWKNKGSYPLEGGQRNPGMGRSDVIPMSPH